MNPDTVEAHLTGQTSGPWQTRRFNLSDLRLPVQTLHFVALVQFADFGPDGPPPTNHWNLLLQTADDAFVRIDALPADIDRRDISIFLESGVTPEGMNKEVIHRVSAAVRTGTIVADVLGLIADKRRDRYVFAPIGEGCRFWLYTLAADFVETGFVSEAKGSEVRADLLMYWPYPEGSEPRDRPMQHGQFV